MKKKKICHRILAAVVASVMLLSSMTAFAAPAKSDNPTWEDVWNIQDYVYQNVDTLFEKDELWVVEDLEYDITHAPAGQRLLSEALWNQFMEYDAPFAEPEPDEVDGEEEITGARKENYSAWYDAAVAVVDGITTATGEYYVDESLWQENESLWSYIDPIWRLDAAGKIIIVDTANGDTPPDETTMENDTYWVYKPDWTAFCTMNDAVNELCFNYFGTEDAPKDPTADQVAEVNAALREMANFILGKLHGKVTPPEPEPVSTSRSSSRRTESSEPEEAPVLINQVVASDGTKSLPTIEGVYGKVCVAGAVFKDDKNKIKQSAGLTEEEVKNGVVIKSYVCDSLNKDMNKNLAGAAAEKGWKLLGVINNDLYKMDKGKISPVRKVSEPLTVLLGVPEKLRDSKYEFAVLCYDEGGNLVEMKDADADKATVTVSASDFGYWAIVYREAVNN